MDRLRINKKLLDAGCKHLFDIEQEAECDIMSKDDVIKWNHVKDSVGTYPEDMRLIDLTSDKNFHDAIHKTLKKLESIGRFATNQRATVLHYNDIKEVQSYPCLA